MSAKTVTECPVNFETTNAGLKSFVMELYPSVISSSDWTSWPLEAQAELRLQLDKLNEWHGKIRQAFDKVVWAGHENGTVDRTIEPIRAKSEFGTKPGRKAVVKSAEELFDRI